MGRGASSSIIIIIIHELEESRNHPFARSSFNRCKYDPLIHPRVVETNIFWTFWMVDAMTNLAIMALVSSHDQTHDDRFVVIEARENF